MQLKQIGFFSRPKLPRICGFMLSLFLMACGGGSKETPRALEAFTTATPNNILVSISGREAKIQWSATVGAVSYRVFRDGSTVPLCEVSTTTCTDTQIDDGKLHFYQIQSINNKGITSPLSDKKFSPSILNESLLPPKDVENLQVQLKGPNYIHIEWSTGANSGMSLRYQVFRNDQTRPIAEVTQHYFDDLDVIGGVNYTYSIKVINEQGQTSNGVSALTVMSPVESDTTPPTNPSGLQAALVGPQAIQLLWNPSRDNTGIKKYRVWRLDVGKVIAETENTSYVDRNLQQDSRYEYRISALDFSNNSSGFSNAASANTPKLADTSAPSIPQHVRLIANDLNRVEITWDPSQDNVGVNRYQIFRNNAAMAIGETTGLSFSDFNINSNTNYFYQVVALDAAGNGSERSEKLYLTTPMATDTVPPMTPSNLVGISKVDGTILLSWQASTDNVGINKYQIYRNGLALPIAETKDPSFIDTKVTNGIIYSYQVRALDAENNASGFSNIAVVKLAEKVDNTAPTTPSGLALLAISPSRIDLSWNPSTDDNYPIRYQVFRNQSTIALAEITATSFVDNSVFPNSRYSYQVRALDPANNASTLSTSASIITPALPDTTAPSRPLGLNLTSLSPSKVAFSWQASIDENGISQYLIYRSDQIASIASTKNLNYVDNALIEGKSYQYTVIAIDNAGNRSESSNALVVNIPVSAKITSSKIALVGELGQTITLSAQVEGSSPLTYQWFKNGSPLSQCSSTSCQLSFISEADAGTYSLNVSNTYGNNSAAIADLSINSMVVHAKTCSASDLQAAINKASTGAIVDIPAGSCDWGTTPTLKFKAGIALRGAGKELTKLRRNAAVAILNANDNPPNTDYMLEVDCSNGLAFEFSGISLIGNDKLQTEAERLVDHDGGLNLTKNCKDFRVHDAQFSDFSNAAVTISGSDSRGVIFNNTFDGNFKCQPDPVSCLGYGVAVLGSFDWPKLQLGTADAVFIEDNVFSDNRHGVASNYGSRYVVRKNTFIAFQRGRNFAMVDAHGLSLKHGSRSWEIYQNTFIDKTTTQYNTASIGIRGGDGVIWGNNYPSTFHTVANFFSESSCKKSDGSLQIYPMADQTTDAWLWENTYKTPTLAIANYYGVIYPSECANFFAKDRDYHLTPRPGYQAYTYPHPLRSKKWGN